MSGIAARLTLIATCCGLLTSVAWSVTESRVISNQEAWASRQLREVAGDHGVVIEKIDAHRYLLLPGGETNADKSAGETVAGFIFETITNSGYNGRIAMWLAVADDGTLLGVRVTDHRETPGIGDGIDVTVSDWILGFDGRSLENPRSWAIGDGFDKMTGATITSRAVVSAVRDGLLRFEAEKDAWLLETRE